MNNFSEGFRYLLAIFFFCLGVYLIFDLFAFGLSIPVFIGSIACFYLAHYIKPSTRKEDRAEFDMYDLIDIITDFPYRFVATVLRGSWRMFGNAKDHGGFDIDD